MRKAVREKIKNDISKLSKRKRRSSAGGTAVRAQAPRKGLSKPRGEKRQRRRTLNKTMRSASVAKARSIERATSKEVEAKLRSKSKESRKRAGVANAHRRGGDARRCRKAGFRRSWRAYRLNRIGGADKIRGVRGQGPEGGGKRRPRPRSRSRAPASGTVSSSTSSLFIPLMGLARLPA